MLVNRLAPLFAAGFGVFTGISQASPVLKSRDDSTAMLTQALSILTTFDANVAAILPQLSQADDNGQDTTPLFERLYLEYDVVINQFSGLADDTSEQSLPIHHQISALNSATQSSVNQKTSKLKPTPKNKANRSIILDWIKKLSEKIKLKVKYSIDVEVEYSGPSSPKPTASSTAPTPSNTTPNSPTTTAPGSPTSNVTTPIPTATSTGTAVRRHRMARRH